MAISGCGTFTLSGLLKNYICSRGDIFISILEKEITLYFMHYKKNKEPEHAALEELIQLREQNSDPHWCPHSSPQFDVPGQICFPGIE